MHRAGRSIAGYRLPRASALALLAGMVCLPLDIAAQSPAVLNRVLFDPQPLAPLTQITTAPTVAPLPDVAPGQDIAFDGEGIGQYLDLIASTELDNGPYAPELMEQFLALGEAYQQQGNHETALEAFDKAEQIARINSGLYAPQQFTIVENMIASHMLRGEVQEANARQQYLLFLKRQYYGAGSLELVPALATLGNWNMDAFRSLLNQSNAANFPLGLNTSSAGGFNMPNPKLLAFINLYQAQGSYYQAIMNLTGNRQYSDPRLPELERNLIETTFLAANRDGILKNPDFYLGQRSLYTGTHIKRNMRGYSMDFYNGRNAYQRMRIYQEVTGGTDRVAVAQTIIALGDWYLLFERETGALNLYREAHQYMTEHGVPEAAITALLTPSVPQQLPVFTPLPHSREKFGISADATRDYDGHIDLSFRLSRFGNVSHIQVLDRTGPLTQDMERRLRRMLRSSPFRPRFSAGEPLTSEQVSVRYYFAQL